MENKSLITEKEILIRFNEVDSMGIVWHGSYATYFEDGREAFGKEFGLGYLDIFENGYYAPLVSLEFSFKKPLIYGDTAIIKTTYIPTDAAKIIFEYTILNQRSGELIATGKSIQVFLDRDYKLILYNPEFYENWKMKLGVM